jgi:hypothetical protein
VERLAQAGALGWMDAFYWTSRFRAVLEERFWDEGRGPGSRREDGRSLAGPRRWFLSPGRLRSTAFAAGFCVRVGVEELGAGLVRAWDAIVSISLPPLLSFSHDTYHSRRRQR